MPLNDPLPSSFPPVVATALRVAGGVVGGYLVGKGYFTAEQAPQIGGAALSIIAAGWAIYASWKKNQKLKAAIIAPAGKAI